MPDSAVTRYVFLDTEVFRTHQLDFKSPALQRFMRLAVEGPVCLLLTTVTKGEVMDDLKEKARDAIKALKEVRRLSSTMRKIMPEEAVQAVEHVARDEAIAILQKEFDDFIAATGASVLGVDVVSSDSIFKKYFEGTPPFGGHRDNKKVEFPDAFAFGALEAWSKSHEDRKIYVVSNDGDWKQMCTGHQSLISIARIDELFQHFTDTELGLMIKGGLEKQEEKLLGMIHDKAESLDVYLAGDTLINGEIENFNAMHVDIMDINVVEIVDDGAYVSVYCDILINAEVVADDPHSGIKDPDTKVVHYQLRLAGTVYHSMPKSVMVTVTFDQGDPESVTIESVEFEDNNFDIWVEEAELGRVDYGMGDIAEPTSPTQP